MAKLSFPLLSCVICVIFFASCGVPETATQTPYEHNDFAMGTIVNQTIYGGDYQDSESILRLLTETEDELISWRKAGTEIAEINEKAGNGEAVFISEKTARYLDVALRIAEDSEGAFDPTIGKLSRLWNFDEQKNKVPEKSDIDRAKNAAGYANLSLGISEKNTAALTSGAALDLGAIGKGIGCDEAENYLKTRSGITGALISMGGSSILTYGEKKDGVPWKVALQNPRDKTVLLGTVALSGTNHIATSGDYERYFEIGGRRYHHILDPSTGYPADSGLMSVTVVGKSGVEVDALSTACFVLGYERAQSLLAKYHAEAIFVRYDKKILVTDGLKDLFVLMSEDYQVSEK